MSKSEDRFIKESANILNAAGCKLEAVEEIQKRLIDIALFLSENNIKGLDAKFVPAHLLNTYDRFAFELANLKVANDAFNQMSDKDLASLRRLCEDLSRDFTRQRHKQVHALSSKERKERFIKDSNDLLSHHKLEADLSNELQTLLIELANFMVDNSLEYIDLNEWNQEHQHDFERFAKSFDRLVENNQELDSLGDEKLHQLLHLCELFAATEIAINSPVFEELNENYLSEKIRSDISCYLEKEGLPSNEQTALLNHFEKIAHFMKKHNVQKVKLELVPDDYKDDFSELIDLTYKTADLSSSKVSQLHKFISF